MISINRKVYIGLNLTYNMIRKRILPRSGYTNFLGVAPRPFNRHHKYSVLNSALFIPQKSSVNLFAPVKAKPAAAFWGDSDGDGFYNGLDCDPYNKRRQGLMSVPEPSSNSFRGGSSSGGIGVPYTAPEPAAGTYNISPSTSIQMSSPKQKITAPMIVKPGYGWGPTTNADGTVTPGWGARVYAAIEANKPTSPPNIVTPGPSPYTIQPINNNVVSPPNQHAMGKRFPITPLFEAQISGLAKNHQPINPKQWSQARGLNIPEFQNYRRGTDGYYHWVQSRRL
jgi:hypothetical protein